MTLMGFSAIRNRFKTEFPIAAMCFVKPAPSKKILVITRLNK